MVGVPVSMRLRKSASLAISAIALLVALGAMMCRHRAVEPPDPSPPPPAEKPGVAAPQAIDEPPVGAAGGADHAASTTTGAAVAPDPPPAPALPECCRTLYQDLVSSDSLARQTARLCEELARQGASGATIRAAVKRRLGDRTPSECR